MLETMLETIIGFGYTGWIVTFVLVATVRWSVLEHRFFEGHEWHHLE